MALDRIVEEGLDPLEAVRAEEAGRDLPVLGGRVRLDGERRAVLEDAFAVDVFAPVATQLDRAPDADPRQRRLPGGDDLRERLAARAHGDHVALAADHQLRAVRG